jgi:hypothetical protein
MTTYSLQLSKKVWRYLSANNWVKKRLRLVKTPSVSMVTGKLYLGLIYGDLSFKNESKAFNVKTTHPVRRTIHSGFIVVAKMDNVGPTKRSLCGLGTFAAADVLQRTPNRLCTIVQTQ